MSFRNGTRDGQRERDSDRPREKKTWRELDKARDSGAGRREREDRERAAALTGGSNTAYDKYKKNLERLWSQGGGKLMELVGDKKDAPPGAQEALSETETAEPQRAVIKQKTEDRQKEREVREGLKKAVTPMEVKAAVNAFLAVKTTLPEDLETLSKVLSSPTEDHQQRALKGLLERTDLNTTQGARLLKGRLQTILLTAGEEDTRALANEVKSRVG